MSPSLVARSASSAMTAPPASASRTSSIVSGRPSSMIGSGRTVARRSRTAASLRSLCGCISARTRIPGRVVASTRRSSKLPKCAPYSRQPRPPANASSIASTPRIVTSYSPVRPASHSTRSRIVVAKQRNWPYMSRVPAGRPSARVMKSRDARREWRENTMKYAQMSGSKRAAAGRPIRSATLATNSISAGEPRSRWRRQRGIAGSRASRPPRIATSR
jgi:hypothetical protein